jgi:membrane protease YdiL (CAAX protease family)
MKKFLTITGFVALYLLILYVFSDVVNRLWWSFMPEKFAKTNYDWISLIAFVFTLLVFVLIFKLRKENMIKVCNFKKLSAKNFIRISIMGVLMGTLTCCVCNTSFIIKNFKIFGDYLHFIVGGNSSFIVFLLIMTALFVFEEMMFRGIILSDVRKGCSLYPAIIISTLIYGLLNYFTMGLAVGVYASIAAFFYTLGYVYMDSLFASITLQAGSMYVIALCIKTGVWPHLKHFGDAALYTCSVIIALIILTLYYFIYKDYKKTRPDNDVPMSA